MNVKHLYTTQFEELREKIFFTYCIEDLNAIGAFTDDWNATDWNNWNNNIVTDDMIIKAFDGYTFHCDDFFSTAGMYTLYPDKMEV